MSTIVAVEGNQRKGEMTLPELEQCVLDLNAWFQRYQEVGESKSNYVSRADIEKIEKIFGDSLPGALVILLTKCGNSPIWFMDKCLLTADDIFKYIQKFNMECIPFAGNEDDMLVISAEGSVCEWDDDGVGDVVASSLPLYLEEYRNFLLNGHGEFLADVGVIEKMGIASSHK
jgi:hypothetical protein